MISIKLIKVKIAKTKTLKLFLLIGLPGQKLFALFHGHKSFGNIALISLRAELNLNFALLLSIY